MGKRVFFLLAGVLLLLNGCGGDDGGGPVVPETPDSPAAFVSRGWERFENGDDAGAESDFLAALDLDGNHGPALAGAAWALLGLAASDVDMQTVVGRFDAALVRGETGPYVTAGRAAARLAVGQWSGAVTDAVATVQADVGFVFEHRTSFTAIDLQLIVAFAEAAAGELEAALATADMIQDSGIDAAQSASWVVGGTAYPCFAGAVLAHLAVLSENHAG